MGPKLPLEFFQRVCVTFALLQHLCLKALCQDQTNELTNVLRLLGSIREDLTRSIKKQTANHSIMTHK